MINKVFAQNFVRKMQHTMKLKVNVMDERGVIVASASKERVGDFHLCAYEIIQKNLPMLITREPTKELIGVNAPGVNLRLTSNNETIGVIGVTGDPVEVTAIAKMVKLTFETMYEYEYKKNAAMKGNSGIWNFAHTLLAESPINESSVKKAAGKLNVSDGYPRIPIYIYLHSEYRGTVIQHFIDSCASLSCHHHQDIPLPVDKGILFMKACKNKTGELRDREFALECIDAIEREFLVRETVDSHSLSYRFSVGTIQTMFLHYQGIYHDLLWLSARNEASSNKAAFLWENIAELMAEQLPGEFLDPLLFWYSSLVCIHMEPDLFMETVSSLIQADMKLDAAAQLLHLHKNSVIARLKKIKELLGINPISSPRDAAMLQYLYIYMKKQQKS